MKKEKKFMKNYKGITLIALVITIVILIILATVTINAIFGDNGLIKQTELAVDYHSNAIEADSEMIEQASDYLEEILNSTKEEKSEIEIARDSGKFFDSSQILTDAEGNSVKIPENCKIASDSGIRVEEGIVIENADGNQLVWIPVGTYKTTSGEKENLLARRIFTSEGATIVEDDDYIESVLPGDIIGEGEEDVNAKIYGEENENSIGHESFENFRANVDIGFYIGRYEVGYGENRAEGDDVDMNGISLRKGENVYNYITRDEAFSIAENWSEIPNGEISLISSYAWDTALNFICQNNSYELATTTSNQYGNIETKQLEKLGEYEKDKYCNIYDMIGNLTEWTTEYAVVDGYNEIVYTARGGNYWDSYFSASIRMVAPNNYEASGIGFRIQAYVQ